MNFSVHALSVTGVTPEIAVPAVCKAWGEAVTRITIEFPLG